MFSKTETDFNLERHLIPFLQDVPFFAEISRHLRKIPTRDMPTAAVTYNPESEEMTLFWNPDFLEKQGNWQIRGLLTHEFYHLIFGHLYSRRKSPPTAWNIATDLAINSIIIDNANSKGAPRGLVSNQNDGPLPDCGLIPGEWPRHPEGRELSKDEKEACSLGEIISNLPKMKASEWYFNKLMDEAKKAQKEGNKKGGDGEGEGQGRPEKGDGSGKSSGGGLPSIEDLFGEGNDWINSMDEHGAWDEVPDEQRELVEGKVKSIIEKAVRHADSQAGGWGTIPANLREDIRRSISTIVNWRNVLRQFVGSITRGRRTTSIKRINKRYPYIHPGTKRGYVAKLLIAIDMSGSVDNEMLEMFFGELANLTKKVDIDILPFDSSADVKDVFTWKRGTSVPTKRTKCGGTDFNAPTIVANDPKNRGRWDGMLIMTDGECSAPIGSRLKRGWVIGQNHKLLFSTNELVIQLDDGKPKSNGAWH